MTSTQRALGLTVSLLRYPVKSMMGEELNAAEVTKSGLLGDRAYALVDAETGKVASAKNPRRWPRLFDFRAAYTEPPRKGAKLPPVRLTLPDGTVCQSEQPDIQAVLSAALGRTATLTLTPPLTRFSVSRSRRSPSGRQTSLGKSPGLTATYSSSYRASAGASGPVDERRYA